MPRPSVLCFGEILWDFLPDALHAGGAPFNVAYHLHRQGVRVHVASAVGRDALGDELLRRLAAWEIPTAGIARDAARPTGFVRATLGAQGDARYEIVRRVAWDRIPAGAAALAAARRAGAFVFGSLAQRSPANRAALRRLLAALPPDALRVFDVNLRPPHDDLALVHRLAREATLLKLNADEAARLAGKKPAAGREEAHARVLAAAFGCAVVVVTAGARGAGLLRDGRWHWAPGRRVEVVDTVGAGDAFLATLLAQLLSGYATDADALVRACRTGEWVASCRGATPAYPPDEEVRSRDPYRPKNVKPSPVRTAG
jgi:fructokinase